MRNFCFKARQMLFEADGRVWTTVVLQVEIQRPLRPFQDVRFDETLKSILTWTVHPIDRDFFKKVLCFFELALEAVIHAGDGAGGFRVVGRTSPTTMTTSPVNMKMSVEKLFDTCPAAISFSGN